STTNISTAVSDVNIARARTLLEQAKIEADDLTERVGQLRTKLSGRSQPRDPQALTSEQTNGLEAPRRALERQAANAEGNESATSGTNRGAGVRLSIARKHTELEDEMSANATRALPTLSDDVRQDLVAYRVAMADLGGVASRREWLSEQVTSYERNLVLTPGRELEQQRAVQGGADNRQLYNSFLQQSTIAQIAEAFENAKVSGRFIVLEPATRPLSPSKPNRPMLVMLALLIGAVVGVGTVLVVEHHDESVKNAEEVESLIGLPVLA